MSRFLPLLLLLLLAVPDANAQLRLPALLADHAVLQRDREIPVWGWAAPGATVEVALGDARQSARADGVGRWRLAFPAMAAGGPVNLVAESRGERVEAHDLLVGDVWVLSGQSNMEWPVRDANDAPAEMAAAQDARIRHFEVPRSFADDPQSELAGGAWAVASPETVGDFSAVGFFFARDLRQHLNVPIGLVNATWGGSRIEPWMSAEMLGLDEAGIAALAADEQARRASIRDRLRASIGALPETDAGTNGEAALWADPALDDSGWATIPVPALWETAGYDGLDGVAWYRQSVTLTAQEAAEGVTLGLGMIDDDDVTWINGVEIGRMSDAWNQERRYAAPASALRPGANVLAVRVADHGGGGGIAGAADRIYIESASGARRSLAGDWRFRVGAVQIDAVGMRNQLPMGLWNQMVHPLTQAPVAGVLWYQGESNGDRLEDAAAYGAQFQSLITGWRHAWDQPGLPFLWVQLAGFRAPPHDPGDTGLWPTVRAGQSAALALAHTAEALALDVGDADDIHPRDKQTVGARLALAARQLVYGETSLVASGPRYRSHTVRDGRVVVAFDHGEGLATRDGATLGGFTVTGADGVWHDAQARIEAARVVVQSDAVAAPVAVRYGWADNPQAATLVNAAGLPASPFQAGE